jgi:hypothetical protein
MVWVRAMGRKMGRIRGKPFWICESVEKLVLVEKWKSGESYYKYYFY